MLVGLLALFLLATLRLPLRRVENLDAAALAAFAVPIVLLNERYLEWSVLATARAARLPAGACLAVRRRAAPAPARP